MGYYNRAEATAESYDKDGFLHTGDIGFMDKEGMLTIHDRLKEMIKVCHALSTDGREAGEMPLKGFPLGSVIKFQSADQFAVLFRF